MPGEPINGYVLTTELTTTGGGHCQWAFAARGDEELFIKRFLQPTYPLPDSPGSEKIKAHKRARCERFERQQTEVNKKLAPLSGTGGNLVVARDFFRHGAHYYKVTTKVDVGAELPADIAMLSLEEKIGLLLKVVHSLDILHNQGLVHGDIKPPNILIEPDPAGGRNTKLIDFDNCFVVGSPPPADELVGDLVYYPPEMIDYILGEGSAERLDTKSDMFAVGLTFAEYLTGSLPQFPADYRYPGEAIRNGGSLTLPGEADAAPVLPLIESLLRAAPAERPDCKRVRTELQRIRREVVRGIPSGAGSPAPSATGGPTLRGKLLSSSGKAGSAAESTAPASVLWRCPEPGCDTSSYGTAGRPYGRTTCYLHPDRELVLDEHASGSILRGKLLNRRGDDPAI